MKQRSIPGDVVKDTRTKARTAKARNYARRMMLCLFCLCLTAIWQEKRLAPPVQNGMQEVAGLAMGYIQGPEALSELLAGV